MTTVHVIGATGFIGQHLLEAAHGIGNATGTSSRTTDGLAKLALENPECFDYSEIGSGDIAFVTAAISSPDVCANQRDRAWQVNVEGSSAVISKIRARNARVIFFSSDAVYGEREPEFDEGGLPQPCGEYAEMKRAVEERFADDEGFKAIRLSYVFARDDKFTSYLLHCASTSVPAEIFHPFYRAPIHRDDVIRGVLALATRWNEFPERIINFGGPQILSRIEFASVIKARALPQLEISIKVPEADFFMNRPRHISMRSPVLQRLLEGKTSTIAEAVDIEL
jgi:dTDP-4-dehydrorhamnose reductase